MPSHKDRKTEGNLTRPNPRQKPKSVSHQSDDDSDDSIKYYEPKRFDSFKKGFERKIARHLSSSGGGEPGSHPSDRPRDGPPPLPAGNIGRPNPRQKPKSVSRQPGSDSDDSITYYEPKRFDAFKKVFERKVARHLSSSGGELNSHPSDRPRDGPPPLPDAAQSYRPSKNEKLDPKHSHRAEPPKSEVPKPPGTRGLFIPTYRSPEHFSQHRRKANPTLPPPTNGRRPRDGEVVVRFFDCENLTYSRESLTSPDSKRLASAAVAFLGECQLNDVPETPKNANPGYRGLSLAASQGSYHLHFCDCAGVRPFHGDISADWESVKKAHRRDRPGDVLLVGVGIGEPGAHCS
ncbi:hypothetical protein F5X97DRAFT_323195 [Nemania serpens]|nr:hypothetical protein F5X97DRAFT_323195 [Nemania serpens]